MIKSKMIICFLFVIAVVAVILWWSMLHKAPNIIEEGTLVQFPWMSGMPI